MKDDTPLLWTASVLCIIVGTATLVATSFWAPVLAQEYGGIIASPVPWLIASGVAADILGVIHGWRLVKRQVREKELYTQFLRTLPSPSVETAIGRLAVFVQITFDRETAFEKRVRYGADVNMAEYKAAKRNSKTIKAEFRQTQDLVEEATLVKLPRNICECLKLASKWR